MNGIEPVRWSDRVIHQHRLEMDDGAGVEAYLRDCVFNRGPGGAAKILQMALGVRDDGGVGSEMLSALRKAEKNPAKLLAALRVAREQYEIRIAGRREKF